jgi:glycosyltransferase involved in cell wall biosynthesis
VTPASGRRADPRRPSPQRQLESETDGVPRFSIIVPTYRRAHLLDEALASVLRQQFADWECIVVNDGGTDVLDLPPDTRVQEVRRAENCGPASARNLGIAHARGDYLTFLDDDDIWGPDRLGLAVQALARAPVGICWSATLGEGSTVTGRLLEGDVSDVILDGLTPHLGATAVRRDAMLPFDEDFMGSEDTEWWLRMARASRVATEPVVGHFYRYHDEVRSVAGVRDRIAGSLLLIDRNGGYFASHRRASSFRWKRIGLMAARCGCAGLASRAYARSLAARPSFRTFTHLVRLPLWLWGARRRQLGPH